MKSTFRVIFISVLCLWCVSLLFRFVFRNSPWGIYKKNYQILLDTGYYDAWIIGSSRAETAFETNVLSNHLNYKFFNAGIAGANPPLTYYVLKQILHQHKYPKIIVFDIHTRTIGEVDSMINIETFIPFLHIKELRNNLSNIDDRVKYAYHFPMYELPLYGLRGVAKLIRTITNIPGKYDTCFQITGCYHAHLEYQEGRYLDDTCLSKNSIQIHPVNKMFIDSIVYLCKQKNIFLIFTVTPIYQPEKALIDVIQKIKNYSTEKNILFLDYCNLANISYDKNNFSDKYHLNYQGCLLFTKVFEDTLKFFIEKR